MTRIVEVVAVEPMLVTVAQAAELLAVSDAEVRRLARAGDVTRAFVGRDRQRSYRITVESLRLYVSTLSDIPGEVA